MTGTAYLKTFFLSLFAIILIGAIMVDPKQTFEASVRGLNIWFEVVFPALLPFFIAAELLIGFGVVHFLGVTLEPLMRPLFRVPGVGGFVLAMGLSSGFPMGAKLTARLREQRLLTREEAERLVSFTNTSGPLFMFGAVAVGFFHNAQLGIIIALVHYISAICVGLLMRFHCYTKPVSAEQPAHTSSQSLFVRAFATMHEERVRKHKPIGILMRDAINHSIQTLLIVGGFIIMFSVILNALQESGIFLLLKQIVLFVGTAIGLHHMLADSIIAGVFEMTLGSQMSSESDQSVPLVQQIAVVGGILAWNGLSIHAQVASMIAHTDIRYLPFFVARIFHAILAVCLTFILWHPFQNWMTSWNDQKADHLSAFNPFIFEFWWFNYVYVLYGIVCLYAVSMIVATIRKSRKQKKGLNSMY